MTDDSELSADSGAQYSTLGFWAFAQSFAQLYLGYTLASRNADFSDAVRAISENLRRISDTLDDISDKLDRIFFELDRISREIRGHISKSLLLTTNGQISALIRNLIDLTSDPERLRDNLARAEANLDDLSRFIGQLEAQSEPGFAKLIALSSPISAWSQFHMAIELEKERQGRPAQWVWETANHRFLVEKVDELYALHNVSLPAQQRRLTSAELFIPILSKSRLIELSGTNFRDTGRGRGPQPRPPYLYYGSDTLDFKDRLLGPSRHEFIVDSESGEASMLPGGFPEWRPIRGGNNNNFGEFQRPWEAEAVFKHNEEKLAERGKIEEYVASAPEIERAFERFNEEVREAPDEWKK